ncbi:MAG: hypothetical protein AB7S57_04180 [Acetobacteraceae bacterium]
MATTPGRTAARRSGADIPGLLQAQSTTAPERMDRHAVACVAGKDRQHARRHAAVQSRDRIMRTISTRTHALFDYSLGIVLIALPTILGIANGTPLEWIPILLGIALLTYSALTNYELGAFRFIPMKIHLGLDIAGGIALIIFAFIWTNSIGVLLLFLALGIMEIIASVVTREVPGDMQGVAVPTAATHTSRSTHAMPQASGPSTLDGRPIAPIPPEQVENVEQLRRAIDSGRTGDKIAMTDPAAAPLGSDDEAAQPHDEKGLEIARRAARR